MASNGALINNLDGKKNIVIVGGGIIGCTTAYFLTRHPKFDPDLHKITLLEATAAVATGASGKAGGLLGLWAYPDNIVPLSYRLHRELAAEHDGAQKWGYRKVTCGTIQATITKEWVSDRTREKEEGRTWEKLPKQNGEADKLLKEGDLPSDLDWIDSNLVQQYSKMGGAGKTETAQVHPYHFTTSVADLAEQAGVEFRMNAKVTKLDSSKNGVESVEYLNRTTDELQEIKQVTDVVVTAGPWTSRLLPRAKIDGLRAHSVVFEADISPHAVFTNISLPPTFVPDHRAKAGLKRRHKGNVDPEIYARPFNEAYACGEPDTLIPLPETADLVEFDEDQCDDMISYISTVSPVLGAAPIKAKQACYLPQHIRFGQEVGPLIGPTLTSGLWVAAGHTCWGIQNGPGTGKLMSEYILDGEAKSADIENLDPRKFKV